MPPSPAWLTPSQAAARLQVSGQDRHPLGQPGPPRPPADLGGHRRFDPALIDALVQALTYRP